MKSFENINILLELKLFYLKNFFLEESLHLREKHVFDLKKNFFFGKHTFLTILEKNFFTFGA